MTQTIEDKVLARIYGRGRGWAFSQVDFAGLGSRSALDMALIRLTNKSTIRRVIRGVYDYPRPGDLLGEPRPPDVHQVAQALARKFGWRIQPGGAAALNLLGLSTQVPARYVYQSDGPNRTYEIGRTRLTFKHVAPKEAGFRHGESGILVQALKALGEEHVSEEAIARIRAWLPPGKRAAVLKDTQRATGWVYAAIQRICREPNDG